MIRKDTLVITFFVVLMTACKSYNPNSNIEAAYIPPLNENNEDPEFFIKSNLKLMYPNIGNFLLEKKINEYEVNFRIGGSTFKTSFNLNGNWKNTKVDIRYLNKVNENVKETIRNSDFKKMRIVKKEMKEKPGFIEYNFFFQDSEIIHKLKYDRQGEVIKYEKKSVQLLN